MEIFDYFQQEYINNNGIDFLSKEIDTFKFFKMKKIGENIYDGSDTMSSDLII